MTAAILAGLGVVIALLGPRPAGPALGQGTTVRVVSPGTASVSSTVAVEIRVEDVANLGAYEWGLAYDPALLRLDNVTNGPFLGSTGRTVPPCSLLLPPGIDTNGDTVIESPVDTVVPEGTARFGCNTTGQNPAPSTTDSKVLSSVTFTALASGTSPLSILAALADPFGDDIPTGVVSASITVAGGATPTPGGPSPTPGGPSPTPGSPTPTPVGPSPTPVGPTATPVGPTPTPAPTPPPEQSDWVELAAGCNPIASTYPDGTTVQTLAAAIAPPDILNAMWAFEGGLWLGYSPLYAEASNLATRNFLDVVFFCVDAVGTFVRPLV
jgi:hypothetical protein